MLPSLTSRARKKFTWLSATCAMLVAASLPPAIAQTIKAAIPKTKAIADIPHCGSFLNLHFLQDQTSDEKLAAACFTEHLASCSPARIEVILKSLHWNQSVAIHSVYEIKGRKGAFCIIEKRTNVDEMPADVTFEKPNIVCKVPMNFIETVMKKAKEQGRKDLIFVSLLTAIGADKITDPDTGKNLTFECFKPQTATPVSPH